MRQKPRSSIEPLVDNRTWKAIIFYSAVIAACCLLAVFISHNTVHNTEVWNLALCNNILFYTLILSQLFHAFNMDSGKTSLWRSEVVRNKYLWGAVALCLFMIFLINLIPPIRSALSLYQLSLADSAIIMGGALVSFLIIRLTKTLELIES